MSEIRVPVTVPGAQRAAQELRGVQQAALGVGKAEEAAARGADRLTMANKRLADSSRLAARSFQAAGRFGGMAGGVLGRIGGGLGSAGLGAMGPLAAGAAVAGLALMKLASISNHNVERATALAKAMSDMRNTVDAARKQGGANSLSASKENGQVIRQLIAGGMSIEDAKAIATEDAPEVLSTLSGYSDHGKAGGRADTALYAAKALKALGITGSLTEGLGKLGEDRVANAMGSDGDPINRLVGEILGEQRGGLPVSSDDVRTMRARIGNSPEAAALDKIDFTKAGARDDRMAAAIDGRGAVAAMNDRADWNNPLMAAVLAGHNQQEQAIAAMRAAAEAEMSVIATLKDVFMPGGSFETQLRRAMNDRAKVVNGTTN